MFSSPYLFFGNQSRHLIFLLLLAISACSTGDSTVTTQVDNKKGIPIPSIVATALPDTGTLSAYIRMDDGPRQQMIIEDGFASIVLTGISPGEHTFTVVFEFVLLSSPNRPFVLASATKTINLGAGENTLSINDSEYETEQYDEDGDGQSNLTEINNNTNPLDDIALFTISGISANTTETGGIATFSIALSTQPNADVLIAIASSDTSEGTVNIPSVTFTPSNWDVVQTITITGVDDNVADGNQTYFIELAPATSPDDRFANQNPTDVSVINIDDDSPGFNISPISTNTTEQGVPATFTAQLTTQPTSIVTINISSSDVSEGIVQQSTITFDPENWDSAQTITVTGVDDYIYDGNQTYSIILSEVISNDSNYSGLDPDDVIVNNTDDEPVPGVSLTVDTDTIQETGGAVILTVTASGISTEDIVVNLSHSGTAAAAADYTQTASITILAGSTTGTASIAALHDTLDETDENIEIAIDSVANGLESGDQQVSVTITDDDPPPSVTLSIGASTSLLAEAGGAMDIIATLSEPSGRTVTIDLAYSGSATAGTDYSKSDVITIAAGNTSEQVTITAMSDTVDEVEEIIIIQIDVVTNGTEEIEQQVSAIIVDDDIPIANFSSTDQTVDENASMVTVNVSLDQSSAMDITLPFSVGGTASGNGVDYNLASGTITIATGQSTGSADFTIVDDNLVESDETVVITLNSPTNAALGTATTHTVTITSNDYSIGGTVSGYNGTGLELQNNGGDDLSVSGSAFTFSRGIANGGSYNLTILSQPVGQNCILENSTGVVNNSGVTDIVVRCLSKVSALYSQSTFWNDYVTDDGSDIFNAQGQPCSNLNACFHAGILRKVALPGISSCSEGNFTANDDLNAFSWQCINEAAAASMVSVALNPEARLYDLIDVVNPGQWKSNAVSVFNNGTLLGKTPSSSDWWADTIYFNPVVSTDLGDAGTIHVFTMSTFQSYNIIADKVSVVTDPSVTMNAANPSAAALSASGNNYLWIEGNFSGNGADNGIHLQSVNSSVLRYVQVSAANQIPESAGLLLSGSHNNIIEESNFIENRWSGIQFNFSNANTLRNIEITGHDGIYGNPPADPSGPGPGFWMRTSNDNRVNGMNVNKHVDGISIVTNSNRNLITNVNASNNRTGGIYIYLSQENVFDQVTTSNNGGYGIFFNQGQYNIVSQFTNHNSSTYGARFINSSYNIFSYGTLANSLGYGFSFEDSTQNLLFGVAIVNNNYSGINLFNASNNTLGNIVIANNGNTAFPAGVKLYNSNNNYFTGIYKSGGNVGGDCFLSPDPVMINPGLNTDCTPNGTSDFGAILPITLTDTTFIGKLTIVDQANRTLQQGGAALYANIIDWNHFSNPYRGWGLNGGVFPAVSQQGRCTDATIEPCRIWDWTLNPQDAIARQTLAEPDPLQVVQHPWAAGGSVTFLRNAVEISNDGRGNDNVLCEPNRNEVCIAAYNIASDQGSGTLTDITTSAMSAVGVTMYAY